MGVHFFVGTPSASHSAELEALDGTTVMLTKDFDRIAKDTLQPVLSPLGFSSSRSKHCIFEREIADGIWHFIGPDRSKSGRWYDVKAFASSPIIDPMFSEKAPDNLGIPFAGCFVNRWTGLGAEQQTFKSETKDQLVSSLNEEVIPLLKNKALALLSSLTSVSALLPQIKSPLFRGFALLHLGSAQEAQELLVRESARLSPMAATDKTGQITAMLTHIETRLSSHAVQLVLQPDVPASGRSAG
jgi:hypothetical protein